MTFSNSVPGSAGDVPTQSVSSPSADSRPYEFAAFGIVLALTLFRLWYAGTHELVQDEAYYWLWSRHLAWGYYDNTPLIAPVIHFFTNLLGNTEVGVRAGAVIGAAVATGFIYAIAKRLFGAKLGLAAVIVASVLPLFSVGSVIMTQDPVQLACWAACLYVIWIATERGGLGWWLLAGVLAGLAAMAKLNGLLLLPSTLLFLAVAPSRRRWLLRPEPYLSALLAVLIFLPFVWWNHTHQNAFWIHIGVMGSRSSEHDGLKWLGRYLGDQAGLFSPFLFLIFFASLVTGYRRGIQERDERLLFLWAPATTVFVTFAVVSLRSKVEGNWPAAAYVSGIILVAVGLDRLWSAGRLRRGFAGFAVVFSAILSLLLFFPGILYSIGIKSHDPTKDRTNELYGWSALADRIQAERRSMGGDPFVFGINYRMPSEAAFYLLGHPRTYSLFLGDRANEYMFWEDERRLIGRNAVCIHDSENQDHIDDARAVFAHVVVEPPFEVYRPVYGNVPIRTIQIYRCYGFKGYDVRRWQHGW